MDKDVLNVKLDIIEMDLHVQNVQLNVEHVIMEKMFNM